MKDSSYVIEWLEKVASNAMEMTYVQEFKKRDLVVVYTAWCSKCCIAVVYYSDLASESAPLH